MDLTENVERASRPIIPNSSQSTAKDMLDLIYWKVKSKWPPKNIGATIMSSFSEKKVSSMNQNLALFPKNSWLENYDKNV